MIDAIISVDLAVAAWMRQHAQHAVLGAVSRWAMWSSQAWVVLCCVAVTAVWQRRRAVVALAQLVLAGAVTRVSVLALKAYFARPRPFELLQGGGAAGAGLADASFPSLHAAEVWMAAVIIAAAWPRGRWRGLVWVWAGLVAVQRVYSGAHFVSDVVVGLMIGVAIGMVVVQMSGRLSAECCAAGGASRGRSAASRGETQSGVVQ